MCVPDRPSLPIDVDSSKESGHALVAISRSDSYSPNEMSWGTLINPDKSPAPLLEQLCLGIAQLMPSFDSSGTTDLTPERIATFYRKVGGNYDPLFLGTKSQALSFIYQSLGCFHSLQPSTNPYEPPSVPSLLPNGFVRWQTIQILMDPDEHWRYLQNAVELWDITDAKGEPFPKEIPRDAFPSEPDPEMLQWHEGVSRRLEYDYMKRRTQRASPPNFAGYHYRFSGKDPLPDEEEYNSSHTPRRSGSRPRNYSQFESERPSRRRHTRRSSGEYPAYTSRRPDGAFFARPDGTRSGFSSPRGPSPSSRMDHHHRSRGREQPPWYARPEPEEPSRDAEDESDLNVHDDDPEPVRSRHRSRRHNLSPPSHSRTRRHSHDAYMRKPARDLSPYTPRRTDRDHGHDAHIPSTRKSNSDGTPRHHHSDDRSRSRSSGVKFKEFIFGGPSSATPTHAPDPPSIYTHGPPKSPPPRAAHRHRHHLDPYAAEDLRRGSYSGGSTGGSRPGSGGSSSERPRSFSNAGFSPAKSRWVSPSRGSSGKRYIPTSLAEDMGYMPSRRAPHIYD
ncbi:hypothetical protein N7456_006127 [Penicillium angulare]|uniref:DUF7514 domain-containing protein n=1 Tax=Penicillium angulare TaxID=116970 RepID=A0A9W9FZU2_9EURO|nr:hypothetical protein N7456_006127 [Penicillium angulare]